MRLLLGATAALALLCLAMSVRDDAGRMLDSRGKVMDEKVEAGYSDSWVVEMDVDEKEADAVAESHGFVNLGQVDNCSFWFDPFLNFAGYKKKRKKFL